MSKVTSLMVFGALIAVGGIVFFFRGQLFPSIFKTGAAETAGLPPEGIPEIIPPDSALTEARPCLILADSVLFEGADSTLLNTGESFSVTGIAHRAGGHKRYQGQMEESTDTGSIDAKSCLIFDDQDLFDNFLFSTAENSEVFNRALEELDANSGKSEILKSAGFYARILCNPKTQSRCLWAIDKWISVINPDSIGNDILTLLNSPLTDSETVKTKLSNHFIEAPEHVAKLVEQFVVKPEPGKIRLITDFCSDFHSPANSQVVLLDALNPKASEGYLNAALECLSNMDSDAKAEVKNLISKESVFKSANASAKQRILDL